MDITLLLVSVVVFLLAYIYLYRRDTQYNNLPPGPRPLPLIGTLYKSTLSLEFAKTLRVSYGDIALFYIGPARMIFLNSYELIKEFAVTNGKTFSHRGFKDYFTMTVTNPNCKGIVESDYHEVYRHSRNVSLSIFRDLGVGRSTMEDKIAEEGTTLIKTFHLQNGLPFDPAHIITCAVTNVILSITVNKSHKHDDKEFLEIVQGSYDMIKSAEASQYIDALPILRFVPSLGSALKELVKGNNTLLNYMWKNVQQLNAEPSDDPNFISAWQKNAYESREKFDVDDENFKYILRDLLLAGSETTTTSLKWTIIQMANRPEIQAKAHEEIDRVVGMETQITLDHKKLLPYLEALTWEIQRFNTIVPFGVPHTSQEDSKVSQYDIPKNSFILFNLYGVHMDKETFSDPEEFRPERFINADGKFEKHPNIIPFSIGKRSCLGELLARQELFLFTAMILQKFTFLPAEGVGKIDDKGHLGFTYFPTPFKVRAVSRETL